MQLDSAITYYVKSVYYEPAFAKGHLGISRIFMKGGNILKAIEYQQKAYALNSSLWGKKVEYAEPG